MMERVEMDGPFLVEHADGSCEWVTLPYTTRAGDVLWAPLPPRPGRPTESASARTDDR